MKRSVLNIWSVCLLFSFTPLLSCNDTAHKDAVTASEKKQTYTCPMHPQIVAEAPGQCPICGMDLVSFATNRASETIMLGARQQALANISIITIGTRSLQNYTQLNGRLVINPQQTEYVSSRVPGRIVVLFVKETGVPVRKGQPLYKIYSEQLATLQQEYILAIAQAGEFPNDHHFQQMVQAARQKLLLYQVTEAQMRHLETKKQTDPYVTYTAPASGIVATLSINEGQYVAEGSEIMKLENYQSLWLEADVYPSELKNIKEGQQVKVQVPGFEDQSQTMTISFINPAFQTGSQLTQIRGTINNPGNRWQPGMQATVLLPSETNGEKLTLPVDAVIRDENGTHVWIEKEAGVFAPVKVTTGLETFDQVEIVSGLSEGDKVVATGAYLLYSEYVLKKGKNPMATHQHS